MAYFFQLKNQESKGNYWIDPCSSYGHVDRPAEDGAKERLLAEVRTGPLCPDALSAKEEFTVVFSSLPGTKTSQTGAETLLESLGFSSQPPETQPLL